MREVALVGFSEKTMEGWKGLPKGVEVWSVNCAWRHGIQVDRLLEMHPISKVEEDAQLALKRREAYGADGREWEAEHWEWLKQEHAFPIYMLEWDERIPNAVEFPLDKLVRLFGREAFSSSMDYLLALALAEGYERIYLFGIEMGNGTEYAYQRPNFLYWLGRAEGMGVEIVEPEGFSLLPRRLYGYEEYQMISRQTLEYHLADYKSQLEQAKGKVNLLEGIAGERKRVVEKLTTENTENTELLESYQRGYEEARKEQMGARQVMWGILGAIQAMQHLVDYCDAGEGNSQDKQDEMDKQDKPSTNEHEYTNESGERQSTDGERMGADGNGWKRGER
jgi:hypothetical protein